MSVGRFRLGPGRRGRRLGRSRGKRLSRRFEPGFRRSDRELRSRDIDNEGIVLAKPVRLEAILQHQDEASGRARNHGFDAADCGSDLCLGAAKLEGGRGVDAHFRGLPLDLERDRHAADRLEHEPRQGGQRRDAQRNIARALLTAAERFLAGARFGLPGASGECVNDLGRKRRQQPGPVRRQEIDEHLLGGFENVQPPALRQRDPQSSPVGIVPYLGDVARQLTGESLALDLRRLGKGQHQHAVDGADLDLRLAVELEHDAPEAAHLDTAHRRRAGGRGAGAEERGGERDGEHRGGAASERRRLPATQPAEPTHDETRKGAESTRAHPRRKPRAEGATVGLRR